MLRLSSLALLLATCWSAASAYADARWLFVPLAAPDASPPPYMPSVVDALTHAAGAQGLPVLDNTRAAELVDQASTAPVQVSQDDVRTLQRLADYALRSLAAQDTRTALEQLDGAQRMVDRAPEAYGQVAPRLVLDLCLYRARASLESGAQLVAVRDGVRTCRARIPLEIEPEMLKHTSASVRQLLAEATAELLREPSGRIDVRGPEGCLVRIDGVDAGSVRNGGFSSRVLQGEHRVSLVCGGVGSRSHPVIARGAPVTLTIEPALDVALRTEPRLWLAADAEQASELARALARALESTRVLIVSGSPDGTLRVARSDGPVVSLPHPSHQGAPWPEVQLQKAIATLAAEAHEPPAPARVSAPEPAPRDHRMLARPGAARLRRAELGLAATGVALAAGSAALHVRAARRRNALSDAAYDAERDDGASAHAIGRLDLASAVTGAATGVTVSTALGLWLTSRTDDGRENLWPSLGLAAAGATGLALGGWQLAEAANTCALCTVERDNRQALGGLLVLGGGALLSAPLLHALLVHWPARATARRRDGAGLGVGLSASTLQLTWRH
jgi:hypothetical protein